MQMQSNVELLNNVFGSNNVKTLNEGFKVHFQEMRNGDLLNLMPVLEVFWVHQKRSGTGMTLFLTPIEFKGDVLANSMMEKIELRALERVQKMCEESLSPESFEKWEDIKTELIFSRKKLDRSNLQQVFRVSEEHLSGLQDLLDECIVNNNISDDGEKALKFLEESLKRYYGELD